MKQHIFTGSLAIVLIAALGCPALAQNQASEDETVSAILVAQTTTQPPPATVPETPEQKRRRLELEKKQKLEEEARKRAEQQRLAEERRKQQELEIRRRQEEQARQRQELLRQQQERQRALDAEIKQRQDVARQHALEQQRQAEERRRQIELDMQRRGGATPPQAQNPGALPPHNPSAPAAPMGAAQPTTLGTSPPGQAGRLGGTGLSGPAPSAIGSPTANPAQSGAYAPAGINTAPNSGTSAPQIAPAGSALVTPSPAPARIVAPPPVPGGLSPGYTSQPGPTLSGTTVPLRWSAVNGAADYDIGVRDLTTNALVADQRVAGTSLTLNLVAGRSYRWNLAACNQAGCSAFTQPMNFTVKEGNAPIAGTTAVAATPAPTTGIAPTATTSPTAGTTLATPTPAPMTMAATSAPSPAPAPTLAVPPVPGGLSPGSTSQPGPTLSGTTVPLRWSAVNGAADYDVGVRDLTTNALVVDQRVAGTSLTLTLVAGRSYRWNLAACNQAGCSAFTTPLNFTVKEGSPPITGTTTAAATPAPTTGIAPTTTTTPTTSTAQTAPVPAPTTMAATTAPAPAVAVPAMPGGLSPGSASQPGPTLSGTTLPLRWSAVSGAMDYDVGVRDLTTNALVADQRVAGTSLTLTLVAGRSYRWNLAACNQAGCSSFTTPLNFTVKEGNPPITTATAPTTSTTSPTTTTTSSGTGTTLAAPTPAPLTTAATSAPSPSPTTTIAVPAVPGGLSPGSITPPGLTLSGTTVPLRWSAVNGAVDYDIGVRDLTTNALVADQRVAGTTLTLTLVAGRSYRWNLAACNQAGCSAFTEPLNFVVKEGNPPITGTTSSIATTAPTTTSSSPTISTAPAPEPTVLSAATAASSSTAPTTTTTVSKPAMPSGMTPGSSAQPGPSLSGSSATVKWNAVSGAKYYDFGISEYVNGAWKLIIDQKPTVASFPASNLVAGRSYRWNLAACNDAGCSEFTAPVYFTMAAAAAAPAPTTTTTLSKPVMPSGMTPGSSAQPGPSLSGSSVTVKWNAVSGAKYYDFGISEYVNGAWKLIIDEKPTVPSFPASNLVAGRSYRWNLAACNDAGCSEFTAPVYFTMAPPTPAPTTTSTAEVWAQPKSKFVRKNQLRYDDSGLYSDANWAKTRTHETCLATVYAMLEHALGTTSATYPTGTKYRITSYNYDEANGPKCTVPQYLSKSVECGGGSGTAIGSSATDRANSLEQIKKEFKAGHPVILLGSSNSIPSHFLLAIGVNLKNEIVALDPYGGFEVTVNTSDWRTIAPSGGVSVTVQRYRKTSF